MMVRLHLKVSHRHILPPLVLCLLVVIIGDPVRVLHEDWGAVLIGLAAMVIFPILPFYIFPAFGMALCFKESHIGLGLSRSTTERIVVGCGIFTSYYTFICSVGLISAVEALFVGILFSNPMINQVNLFDQPSWAYWWYPLTATFVLAHTWAERRNLGRAALIIQDEKGKPNIPEPDDAD